MKENNKIKLETKKVMAYPKSSTHQDDYEIYRCLHCGEEYLTQAIKESEMNFCPRHSDFEVCVWCDSTQNKKDMVQEDNEFYCKECNSPKCSQCDEPLDNRDAQFCSFDCQKSFWGDSTEY